MDQADGQALLGLPVRAQVDGWKDARRGRGQLPGYDGVPLHVRGILSSRPGAGGTPVYSVQGTDVDHTTIVPSARLAEVAWDDPSLAELGDLRYPWRADLRRLQSWYRQEILGLEPGISRGPRGRRPVGNWLPEEAVASDPSLNFLADERILRLVRQRWATRGWGGVVERRRLFHNLLSRQPLAFNLFGPLVFESPDVLAGVLRDAYGLDVQRVLDVRIGWAPSRAEHLRPESAFDCFVEYETSRGRGIVGIDTKYAEDLRAQKASPNPAFRAETEAAGSGFRPGAADRLESQPTTVELWYHLLLAKSLQRRHGYNEAVVALTASAADPLAAPAVDGLAAELNEPGACVRRASYEDVVAAAVTHSAHLGGWAGHFRQRYLDLSPVARIEPSRTVQFSGSPQRRVAS